MTAKPSPFDPEPEAYWQSVRDAGCGIDHPHCPACAAVVGDECGEVEAHTTCCDEPVSTWDDCGNAHDVVPAPALVELFARPQRITESDAQDVTGVPETWRLCKRCAVAGVSTPAAYVVPGAPPRHRDILACEDHALPYKTKRPLRPAPKGETL